MATSRHFEEVAMKSALRLAMLLSLMSLPAQAHEVETGAIMVCDTQQQAERYAQVFDGNQQGAISVVNAEANNPSACAVVEVAFVAGPPPRGAPGTRPPSASHPPPPVAYTP